MTTTTLALHVTQFNDGMRQFDYVKPIPSFEKLGHDVAFAIQNWRGMFGNLGVLDSLDILELDRPHTVLLLKTLNGDEYELWEITTLPLENRG
jgi:hypothetical protein